MFILSNFQLSVSSLAIFVNIADFTSCYYILKKRVEMSFGLCAL